MTICRAGIGRLLGCGLVWALFATWGSSASAQPNPDPSVLVGLDTTPVFTPGDAPVEGESLTLWIENIGGTDVLVPAVYDGSAVVLYGHGEGHPGPLHFQTGAPAPPGPGVPLRPGERRTLLSIRLADLFGGTGAGSWGWDLQLESPTSPVHGLEHQGQPVVASAVLWAVVDLSGRQVTSESALLRVAHADAPIAPDPQEGFDLTVSNEALRCIQLAYSMRQRSAREPELEERALRDELEESCRELDPADEPSEEAAAAVAAFVMIEGLPLASGEFVEVIGGLDSLDRVSSSARQLGRFYAATGAYQVADILYSRGDGVVPATDLPQLVVLGDAILFDGADIPHGPFEALLHSPAELAGYAEWLPERVFQGVENSLVGGVPGSLITALYQLAGARVRALEVCLDDPRVAAAALEDLDIGETGAALFEAERGFFTSHCNRLPRGEVTEVERQHLAALFPADPRLDALVIPSTVVNTHWLDYSPVIIALAEDVVSVNGVVVGSALELPGVVSQPIAETCATPPEVEVISPAPLEELEVEPGGDAEESPEIPAVAASLLISADSDWANVVHLAYAVSACDWLRPALVVEVDGELRTLDLRFEPEPAPEEPAEAVVEVTPEEPPPRRGALALLAEPAEQPSFLSRTTAPPPTMVDLAIDPTGAALDALTRRLEAQSDDRLLVGLRVTTEPGVTVSDVLRANEQAQALCDDAEVPCGLFLERADAPE